MINRQVVVSILSLFIVMALFLPAAESFAGRAYHVEINKGRLIKLGTKAESVVVADPEIADIQVVSPRILYVNGRAVGETSFLVIGKDDRVILNATMVVSHNLSKLKSTVRKAFPDAKVKFTSTDTAIVIEGQVASPYIAEKVQRLATSFLREGQTVINMLDTSQGDQVMLMVKVAEVFRGELKRFGINLEAIINSGNFAYGIASGRDIVDLATGAALTRENNDNAIWGGHNTGNVNINGVIDALQEDGLVTILAEPNLTTKSGVSASFLAGGEFPIPVPGQNGTVTIEYRSYGVSLDFTPVVLSDRKISLAVTPEVSALSSINAVKIDGFEIPSITTRRASTTVELGSGESFAIAGLIRRDTTNDISKTPMLGDLPILGTLFRSSQFQQDQTELVIIVTPYIVRGVKDVELATPLDGYEPATDIERILHGAMYHKASWSFADDGSDVGGEGKEGDRGSSPPAYGTYKTKAHLYGNAGFIMR